MSRNKLSKTTTVVNDNSESNGECFNKVIQPMHAESASHLTTDIQAQLDSSARRHDTNHTIGTCIFCLYCLRFNFQVVIV